MLRPFLLARFAPAWEVTTGVRNDETRILNGNDTGTTGSNHSRRERPRWQGAPRGAGARAPCSRKRGGARGARALRAGARWARVRRRARAIRLFRAAGALWDADRWRDRHRDGAPHRL